jgi:hypothetical protein
MICGFFFHTLIIPERDCATAFGRDGRALSLECRFWLFIPPQPAATSFFIRFVAQPFGLFS